MTRQEIKTKLKCAQRLVKIHALMLNAQRKIPRNALTDITIRSYVKNWTTSCEVVNRYEQMLKKNVSWDDIIENKSLTTSQG